MFPMKMCEVQSLIKGKCKWVQLLNDIAKYYRLWKSLRTQYGETSELEAFVAGYTIGNNGVLKEEFLQYMSTHNKLELRDKYREEHWIDKFNYTGR